MIAALPTIGSQRLSKAGVVKQQACTLAECWQSLAVGVTEA
jgi:hypothetical protein